jgi:hypothetical protein
MPSIFKTFGIVLFAPLSFLWQLLTQFLLSPWGLVVPMTLLIALFAVQHLRTAPDQLALYYAEQFETCTDEELPLLLEVLVRMGDHGVPGLVKGLSSQRESVFAACLNVLQNEFDRWTESDQREHHYLVFSEALLKTCVQFSPTAQVEAMRFVDQIMQIRSAASDSPESTVNRQKTIDHCYKLLSQLESARRRRIEEGKQSGGYDQLVHRTENPSPTLHANFAPKNAAIASMQQRTERPILYASHGQPFVPTSARSGNETHLAQSGFSGGAIYNSFAVARPERLAAYQRSQQNQPAKSGGNPRLSQDQTTPLLASLSSPSGAVPPSYAANVASKFAQHFTLDDTDDSDLSDISEEYRNKKTSDSDGFLSPELQNTPLERVPHLPPTQLMQLMHHTDPAYVEAARRTLMSRDGFQEVHMKLAWRLYHPLPAMRLEIMDMLSGTPNIQPSVWMKVLLNDPNNDVRYRTASFLATTSDPALRRMLIDRGKRDSDARIVNLADRLNESQYGNVRR